MNLQSIIFSHKENHDKEAVLYHFIESETNEEYLTMRNDIEKNGFLIKTVIIDGIRGLYGLFDDAPIPDVAFTSKRSLHATYEESKNRSFNPTQKDYFLSWQGISKMICISIKSLVSEISKLS